jgi:hypothetical protein
MQAMRIRFCLFRSVLGDLRQLSSSRWPLRLIGRSARASPRLSSRNWAMIKPRSLLTLIGAAILAARSSSLAEAHRGGARHYGGHRHMQGDRHHNNRHHLHGRHENFEHHRMHSRHNHRGRGNIDPRNEILPHDATKRRRSDEIMPPLGRIVPSNRCSPVAARLRRQ